MPTYTSDDGFSSRPPVWITPWSEHQVLNLGTSYIADWGFIGLSYGAIRSEYGLPEGPEDPAEADDGELIKLNQQRFALAAEYQPQHANWDVLTADLAFTDYDHAEYDDGEPETEFTSKAWEARFFGNLFVTPRLARELWAIMARFATTKLLVKRPLHQARTPTAKRCFGLQERAFWALKLLNLVRGLSV